MILDLQRKESDAMDLIKEADFRKELKSNPRAGYLFFGDEDYLKSFAIKQARELICPDATFAFFNEIRLDAMDFDAQKLIDALMPLPMMAKSWSSFRVSISIR